MRLRAVLLVGGALLAGCTALAPGTDRFDAAGDGAALDVVASDAGDAAADAQGCPPAGSRPSVMVTSDINASATWSCRSDYVLPANVFVLAGATLTVEAGVTVRGQSGAGLYVARGGRIRAQGTATEPVVFTSDRASGMRAPGDWGGLTLLGSAPTNLGREGAAPGLPPGESRGVYGGSDEASDCGTLAHVRVEFAGAGAGGRTTNGLTLAACGTGTSVDFVQVHRARGDGVRLIGGTANLRHVMVTRAEDDSYQWSEGYRGRMQFVVAQQDPTTSDRALEGQNLEGSPDAMPRSSPQIYNATLVGPGGISVSNEQTGAWLTEGTRGVVRNSIFTLFPAQAANVEGESTASGARATPPELTVENSIFFLIGPGGMRWFDATEPDDDGGFSEDGFFRASARANRFGNADPMLGTGASNLTNPRFLPPATSSAASGAAVTPGGDSFFTPAAYVGAFEPGGVDWSSGWTAFPEN